MGIKPSFFVGVNGVFLESYEGVWVLLRLPQKRFWNSPVEREAEEGFFD